MKKRWLTLLLFSGLLFAAAFANAGGPVNPYREKANSLKIIRQPLRATSVDENRLIVSGPSVNQSLIVGREYTWTVSGGSGKYEIAIGYMVSATSFAAEAYRELDTEDNSFKYTFVAPDQVTLLVNSIGADGKPDRQVKAAYRVIGADGEPTKEEKAASVVAEARTAGIGNDYDMAVWLHDWLVAHVEYDDSYTFYGAADALFRGTGVCDAYAKAYKLLCETAGISADRISGGNHAWNKVLLSGEWTMVDTTWDDSDANLRYRYFGLTDELTGFDHTYSSAGDCLSLSNNYYVRTGLCSLWIDEPDMDGVTLRERVMDAFRSQQTPVLTVPLPEGYRVPNRDDLAEMGAKYIVYSVCAWVLNRDQTDFNALQLYPEFFYDIRTGVFRARLLPASGTCGDRLRWEMIPENGTLNITGEGAMTDYDGNAPWKIYGGMIQRISLSKACTALGRDAFSDCRALQTVQIPWSVSSIGTGALPENITVQCHIGSFASAYAEAQSLSVQVYPHEADPERLQVLPAERGANGAVSALYCVECLREYAPSVTVFPDQCAFLPGGMNEMEEECLAGTAFVQVTVPNGVTGIPSGAFAGCANLRLAVIPSSVTGIANDAFTGCPGLVICAPAGSAAEEFARKNGYPYVRMNSP